MTTPTPPAAEIACDHCQTTHPPEWACGRTPANEPDKPPLPVVFQSEPTRVLGYACAVCSVFYSNATFGGGEDAGVDAALRCCQRACLQCGKRIEKKSMYIYCKPCLEKREAEKNAKRIEAAAKIPEAEYDGPVYCEDNEEYYSTVDDLRDAFDGEGLPSEVWACTTQSLTLSADHILDNAFDDHHEDARDALAAGAEQTLQAALDTWINFYAKDVVSWNPDYKRLIVLALEDSAETPTLSP